MAYPFTGYQDDDYAMFQDAILRRSGAPPRRFDEYYRCYPMAMMAGPDRPSLNHGGKVFLPASALEKLTRLHITYPMIFELINGVKEKTTHAGVLEFTAEEGKIYLPHWLMNTLLLEAGDLLQIKSTDLPPGTFIKLQAQSVDFLEITDPKAVLENAFRNFSCLTIGDIFSFEYNEQVYEVGVLEVKPETQAKGIVTMETDLSVDFEAPVGYVEPSAQKKPGAATGTQGGKIHTQGTMAQRINYSAIAPSGDAAATGQNVVAAHFANEGHRLGKKSKASVASTGTSTPVPGSGASTPASRFVRPVRNVSLNGPQPLRLPRGTLFFGYEYVPRKKRDEKGNVIDDNEGKIKAKFAGMGQTLRGKKVEARDEDEEMTDVKDEKKGDGGGGGRRLRDA